MSTARTAAPEIDRLVLSVNRAVGPRHGPQLQALADEVGLDSLEMLPNLYDFLAAGRLTPELARLRMRYAPGGAVERRLGELRDKGLLGESEGSTEASPFFRTLLDALATARADVARSAWGNHPELVATVADNAATVASATSDDHVVAVVHRDMPEPAEPEARLFHRLTTLRYIRQHDHAEAWLRRHLTAEEMVAMTELWHGETIDTSHPGLPGLDGKGYTDDGSLTDKGRQVRQAIEDDTNTLAQVSFDVLEPATATAFIDALRRLPSATP
ncbi:MAG: hypothetical protein H0V96_11155 [Acidimicrobiia bacterium]|nr:hypothetical protein [Acidimicrobiia bacterium]